MIIFDFDQRKDFSKRVVQTELEIWGIDFFGETLTYP